MADQQAGEEVFAVTTERIEAPSWRVTVGWSSERGPAMGRSWVVQLPGSMTPDAVATVEQTMRRAVGAAAEEAKRDGVTELSAKEAHITELRAELMGYVDRHLDNSAMVEELRNKLALQTQIATGATQQRDEQTERLKTAMAKIEWFRGLERQWKELGDIACQYLAPFTSVGMCYVRHGLPVMADLLKAALADVERLTKERDVALSNEADARRERVETQAILNGVLPAHDVGFSADGDEYYIVHTTKIQAEAAVDRIRQLESEARALKASKPEADVEKLSREFHESGRKVFADSYARQTWNNLDDIARAAVRAGVRSLLARFGIEETGEPAGEVGT